MSHFTVLVIGDEPEARLQPFHEFECTGVDDEYVQDVDKTDEARERYQASTETMLRAADGSLHSFFDGAGNWRPEFSRPDESAQAFDKCRRVAMVPDGYAQIEVPIASIQRFADWAAEYYGAPVVPFGSVPDKSEKHKYGYITVDATGDVIRVIDRSNPHKKWDWYALGGRWGGKLTLKAGGAADQAIKRDIDFDAMRDEAGAKAGVKWDNANRIIAGREIRSWKAMREAHPGAIDTARDAYWSQAAVKDLKSAELLGFDDDPTDYAVSRDVYVQRARDTSITTFAVLRDGVWYERGEMGWWGAVHDEKDRDEWNRQYSALLDSVHDFTLLSVYDCHI